MRKLQIDWQGYFPVEEKLVRSKVDDKAGIYKISKVQKDGSLKPFYIGQADSIKMRLLEQITSTKDSCIIMELKKGECQFRFAYLYTKEDIAAVAKALYTRYSPKCNIKEEIPVDAEEVEINYN
ncbi:MAG: hypothetical protein ACYDFU_09485 [Nitrospirota bacterium]